MDRAEHSKRQDWSLEAAHDILPLITPLLDYTVRTLLDQANILRDSVLIQAECIHFEAYVHVSAIMWRVVFKELRGLTNSKGLELHPMELNELYEYLYDLGTILQGDTCLRIFEIGFRPWPHVYKDKGRSKKFYGAVDRNLTDDLEVLRLNDNREDAETYKTIMRAALRCFGMGIIDSLEFTMKDYLRQTDGPMRNDLREAWEQKAVEKMVCHNNFAERPFAVVKEFWRMYPTLSLHNLSWLSHSMVNGTHRCAEVYGADAKGMPVTTRLAGIALTAHPKLKNAVSKLCSVRRKSSGVITKMARIAHKSDKAAQVTIRRQKATEKYDAQVKKQARTAASRDKAEQTAVNNLCTDLHELILQLKSRKHNKESRITFLKDQVYARIAGEHPRLYPGLGPEWRKVGGKIRISAPSKNQTDEDYLQKLVAGMIKEDSLTCGINDAVQGSDKQEYIRLLPSIAQEFTNPVAVAFKHEFSKKIADLATPIDDPVYIALHTQYSGAILYDNETRASQKLFRIAAIQFVRSFASNRPSCWEATCEPVYRDQASGSFVVPQEHKVEGSNILLATALQGYALTEYPNGIGEEGVHLPWVDNYIAHFKHVVEPSFMPKVDSPVDGPSTPLQPMRSGRSSRSSRIQSSSDPAS